MITWRSSHLSDVSTFFWNVGKKQVNKLNTHVSLCSSTYRCTDACHNIAEWEDRHVLGSIHPTHAQPLRSNPFDHCDVVLTVETVVGFCKQIYQQDQYTVRQAFKSDLFSKLSGGLSSVVRELPSTVTTESLTVGLTWAIWAETAQTCRYVHIHSVLGRFHLGRWKHLSSSSRYKIKYNCLEISQGPPLGRDTPSLWGTACLWIWAEACLAPRNRWWWDRQA